MKVGEPALGNRFTSNAQYTNIFSILKAFEKYCEKNEKRASNHFP